MKPILISLIFCALILIYTAATIIIARRRRSQRKTQPPEEFKLLRAPGESLRKKIDSLSEELSDWLSFGSIAALVVLVAPAFLILNVLPWANPFPLLLSGAALFIAASVLVVGKSIQIIDKRANAHLGYLGERMVGEELQAVVGHRYKLVHDVPADMGGWTENLDHVAIGPHGAAVIETKTRSKPTEGESGPVAVEFDGKALHWPRFQNDIRPLEQVQRYAEWLARFIQRQSMIEVPVRMVIAIPGWKVNERVLGPIRVVSGRGAADAVLGQTQKDPPILTAAQIDLISEKLESLCRDVVE